MRIHVLTRLAIGAVLGLATLALAPHVHADTVTYRFDLPAQPLSDALRAVARQIGKNVVFDPALVEGRTAPALQAEMSVEEAMQRLLTGTPLGFEQVESDTILLTGGQGKHPTAKSTAWSDAGQALKVAQAAEGSAAKSADSRPDAADKRSPADPGEDSDRKLDEIVVSAQKRGEQRLQDVPIAITVVQPGKLLAQNELRLQDYFSKIPGVSLFQGGDNGQPLIAIRGIVTGGQSNSTVGIVIDDISYGSSTNPGTLPYAPDIDPGDLERVEVLRGPQGTLYGASSIGGLIRYVTKDPSPRGFSGHAQAGVSTVDQSNDIGYSIRGSANIPLSENAALRASAFKRTEPGFVDYVTANAKDVNQTEAAGGRLAFLWTPLENLSVKLTAMMQDIDRDGVDQVDTSLSSDDKALLSGDRLGTGLYNRDSKVYGANIDWTVGSVELTSLTGYSRDVGEFRLDATAFLAQPAQDIYGGNAASTDYSSTTKKFSEELRALIPLSERVKWMIGGIYNHEDFSLPFVWTADDTATGRVLGKLIDIRVFNKLSEYSAFSNMVFDVTDRFELTVGGRYSKIDQTFSSERSAPLSVLYYGSDPSFIPPIDAGDSAFTYLVAPKFTLTDDIMLYGRIASGYRLGGINGNCNASIPCQYDADTTVDYELGLKSAVLGGRLDVELSAYSIDWKDIQLPVSAVVAYTENAGEARSKGVELSFSAEPLRGVTVSGWFAYNDATFSFVPANVTLVARDGDRLPFSSKYSGALSLDYRFPLTGAASAHLGADVTCVGERAGNFRYDPGVRTMLKGYTEVDLSAGVDLASVGISLYVNNVANDRNVIGKEYFNPASFVRYAQPRSIGVSISKDF